MLSSAATSASGSSPSTLLAADAVGCALLGVSDGAPSVESTDYVANKTQFQLHTLLTEQRHRETMTLSQTIAKDAEAGLNQILAVDTDICNKLRSLTAADSSARVTLTQLQSAMTRALEQHRNIYVYGCGATGRLAKLMESTFWRPFWSCVQQSPLWPRIRERVAPNIADTLIGEMTGADRALISSLEGFEDLQLIGELQLGDRGITRGDLVIGVTEGGETSSVIGTVLAGLRQWTESTDAPTDKEGMQSHLFFVYNNPDDLLLPFHRSASVLNDDRITKLNLATGPQAITGSTRMQATTIETFVIASALQVALDTFLRETVGLSGEEMSSLGFDAKPTTLHEKLDEFTDVISSVRASSSSLATFTRWEADAYAHNHFTTYFACDGLLTVFIDSTERSPTFRLFPLDTTEQQQRKAWIQVWTAASTIDGAWNTLLGRAFRGMSPERYEARFTNEIDDPFLRATALRSLPNAGDEQQSLYDFSYNDQNASRRGGLQPGDLGCLALVPHEVPQLRDPLSPVSSFIRRFTSLPAADDGTPTRVAVLIFGDRENVHDEVHALLSQQGLPMDRVQLATFKDSSRADPLGIRQQTAMKIALNAHSTGVMSILGKVLGNCMVNVSPGNLKLVGRATFLIMSQVNEMAEKLNLPLVSYALSNAVLYDSISVIRADQAQHSSTVPAGGAGGQSAEVALSVVRMLTSLADQRPMLPQDALRVLAQTGLATFLDEFAARLTQQSKL